MLLSDDDSFFSADRGEQFAGRMQNGRFEVVPDAGLFLQYERPDAVATAIDGFLRGERATSDQHRLERTDR